MKKMVIGASVVMVFLLGTVTCVMAGNNFNKEKTKTIEEANEIAIKKEKLKEVKEDLEDLKQNGIDSSWEAFQYRDKVAEQLTLEEELGLKDYLGDLELSLNTLDASIEDMKRFENEGDYDDIDQTLFSKYKQDLVELYDKYRNIIAEGNCSDPEELYNNYYKEFHGIIDGRGF